MVIIESDSNHTNKYFVTNEPFQARICMETSSLRSNMSTVPETIALLDMCITSVKIFEFMWRSVSLHNRTYFGYETNLPKRWLAAKPPILERLDLEHEMSPNGIRTLIKSIQLSGVGAHVCVFFLSLGSHCLLYHEILHSCIYSNNAYLVATKSSNVHALSTCNCKHCEWKDS